MGRQQPPRSPEQRLADQRSFAATREVLGGHRLAADAGTRKMLGFILSSDNGCDGSVSENGFELRFGWNPGPHHYFLALAPAVIGQLLDWAEAIPKGGEWRGLAHPTVERTTGLFPPWSGGARQLWLSATPEAVLFSVRSGEVMPEALPWPKPIEPRRFSVPKVYRDFAPPLSCPHCAVSLSRVRQVSDGSFICAACARSFAPPPSGGPKTMLED